MKRGDLAFFDFLLERFAADDTEVRTAFGRHVHWGYWADPGRADGSTSDFAQAAEAMSRRVWEAAGIQDGNRVLDVGCGFGGTLASLNERFRHLHLVGANVDRRQLAYARSLVVPQPGTSIHLVQCDGSTLPFACGTFDAVMAIQSIFHLRRAEFLREARRLLKPGGRLVVSDFLAPRRLRTVVRIGCRLVRPILAGWTADADAGWTVEDYRDAGVGCGLRLTAEEDITRNTLPTYPVLRRVVGDGANWPARAVAATTELVSGAGVVRYEILVFEAV